MASSFLSWLQARAHHPRRGLSQGSQLPAFIASKPSPGEELDAAGSLGVLLGRKEGRTSGPESSLWTTPGMDSRHWPWLTGSQVHGGNLNLMNHPVPWSCRLQVTVRPILSPRHLRVRRWKYLMLLSEAGCV